MIEVQINSQDSRGGEVEQQDNGSNPSFVWGFREDVEGLRGVALALVLLFHAKIPPFTGGFIGVDVFFVISGFVITGMLLKELSDKKRIDFMRFYMWRVRRLLPASIVCSVSTVIVGRWVLSPLVYIQLLNSFKNVSYFWVNMYYTNTIDYFGGQEEPMPLLHYWSLAVEEQFYFIWPLALALLSFLPGRMLRLVVVLNLMGLSFLFCYLQRGKPVGYFTTLSRAWQFFAGTLLALLQSQLNSLHNGISEVLSLVGLCMVVYCGVQYDNSIVYPGVAALLPTIGSFLVICGKHSNLVNRLLSLSGMRWLGFYSYSLYLYHWPAIVYTVVKLSNGEDIVYNPTMALSSLGVWISIPFALLSNALVETPIRRSTVKFKPQYVVAVLTLFVVGSCYYSSYSISNIEMTFNRQVTKSFLAFLSLSSFPV